MTLPSTAGNHYCIFEVNQATFALSATPIREITSKPIYSRPPCAGSTLAGLWHEGSEFLPILRLPFQSEIHPDQETQVLIIDGPHGHWGLLVGQVLTVAEIEYSQGSDPRDTEWSTAMLGMSSWDGRSVRVLHPDGVYRLSEQMLKRDWNKPVFVSPDESSAPFQMGQIA